VNRIHQLLRSRFLRFAFVGSLGFFVNEAALYLCLHLGHLNKDQAWLPAFLVAVTFTWWGNRSLTFRDCAAKKGLIAEWAAFLVANSIGALVNAAVYFALVHLATPPLNNPLLALAAGTIVGMLFNFMASRHFVFRKNSA
jgi:putative flippase GtrA